MAAVTAELILDEMQREQDAMSSREKVRLELVAMAGKLSSLIDERENERALVEHQVTTTIALPLILVAIYQVEILRREWFIRENLKTLKAIREVAEEVGSADYKYLLEVVTWLKDGTFNWMDLNPAGLSKEIREHLHAATKLLRAELSPN